MINRIFNKAFRVLESIFGTKDYKKAIVLSKSRTGSNLLISILNSSPHVDFKNEVFQRLQNRQPNELWQSVFKKRFKGIKLVGFKIFYYHPLDSDNNEVWERIAEDPDIKIIHLIRENKLRNYLSQVIAHNSGVWRQDKGGKAIDNKKVKLDVNKAISHFKEIEKWQAAVPVTYSKHNILELSYEQLSSDPGSLMEKVAFFLERDFSEFKLNSKLKRQNPEPLEDLIENFESFRTELTQKGYGSFFSS